MHSRHKLHYTRLTQQHSQSGANACHMLPKQGGISRKLRDDAHVAQPIMGCIQRASRRRLASAHTPYEPTSSCAHFSREAFGRKNGELFVVFVVFSLLVYVAHLQLSPKSSPPQKTPYIPLLRTPRAPILGKYRVLRRARVSPRPRSTDFVAPVLPMRAPVQLACCLQAATHGRHLPRFRTLLHHLSGRLATDTRRASLRSKIITTTASSPPSLSGATDCTCATVTHSILPVGRHYCTIMGLLRRLRRHHRYCLSDSLTYAAAPVPPQRPRPIFLSINCAETPLRRHRNTVITHRPIDYMLTTLVTALRSCHEITSWPLSSHTFMRTTASSSPLPQGHTNATVSTSRLTSPTLFQLW